MELPAFQTLIDEHGRDVHRFLSATVGHSAADDCYQETWLAALRAYPRLRNADNLRSWLLTIAHRKSIDYVRARNRQAVPVADVPERADESGSAPLIADGERRALEPGPGACAQAAHGAGAQIRVRRRARGDRLGDGHQRGGGAAKRLTKA